MATSATSSIWTRPIPGAERETFQRLRCIAHRLSELLNALDSVRAQEDSILITTTNERSEEEEEEEEEEDFGYSYSEGAVSSFSTSDGPRDPIAIHTSIVTIRFLLL